MPKGNPGGYYGMIAREVEKMTRPARAKARRAKAAFKQFDVFGTASKRIGSASEPKKGVPNYGKRKK